MEANGEKQSTNAIALSALTNGIDDLFAQGSHILIMTTNAIEQLDNALLHPWRIEMEADFWPWLSKNNSSVLLASAANYVMGVLGAGGQIRPHSLRAYAELTSDNIVHLSVISAKDVPLRRYRAAEVQSYTS
ncbi:hypothetical protein AnigIFM63604_006998, partial [Aspergillus niger]